MLPEQALDKAGEFLYDYLVEFHSRTDWREGAWFPGVKEGEFAKKVVEGWQPPTHSGNRVEIRNNFGLLRWKTTGGVITPKRASHLTIPLIPEARGRSVKEFHEASGGQRLFRPGRTGMALCRKIGEKIEAVYALSLGVKQRPYPDAMPGKFETAQAVRASLREAFEAIE